MAKKLVSGFIKSFHVLILVLAVRIVSCETISSCSKTPYPEVCNSFISTSNPLLVDETQLSFRDLSLHVTMKQAQEAYRLVSAMNLSLFDDERAKAAWSDCLELFDDTVSQLNRSIKPSSAISMDMHDAQTWLSAAIMNHRTCENGFVELNASSYLTSFDPFLYGNFSKLLSNSLAINKANTMSKTDHSTGIKGRRHLLSKGFPAWVSSGDRKLLQASPVKADTIVAQDGSGNYKTITEAVAAARSGSGRFIIHVKAGVYKENIEIPKSKKNIMLIGDGIGATIVTGNRNVQDGSTTFRSATFAVSGDGFIARDMTFENTAGPQKHQAVALRSGSDLSVFYRCSFKGYQDTLYVYSQRQFYRNCDIYGTVDMIFGDAAAVLQSCNIYVRRPMNHQSNTITAQGRTDPNENTGISIHNSRVTAASDLKAVQGSFKTYLGRPWQKYSRTVYMKTYLDGLIDPAGWLQWSGNFALNTLYYGEYMNTGGGAGTGRRVKWPGYRVISAAEAVKFTAGNFLGGSSWLPRSGVPYELNL